MTWLLIGLLSGLYAAADHKAVVTQVQWHAPITADEFVTISRGCDTPFGLYLRPSDLTDADLRVHKTFNPFQKILPFGFGMPFIEMQEWIFRSANADWRFVSMGGSQKGNVRPVEIVDSGDWARDIETVGHAVAAVVIVPGSSCSIYRELIFFTHQRPNNTVILIPPRRGNERYFKALSEIPKELDFDPLAANVRGEIVLPSFLPGDENISFHRYPLNAHWLCRALEARRSGARVQIGSSGRL